MIHLFHHRIARVQKRAGVNGFRCEKQPGRDDADDGGKTPAVLIRIVGAHDNETGNGGITDSAEGKRRVVLVVAVRFELLAAELGPEWTF